MNIYVENNFTSIWIYSKPSKPLNNNCNWYSIAFSNIYQFPMNLMQKSLDLALENYQQ